MGQKLSYPKSKLKVLLLENIHPDAEKLFIADGYPVERVSKALSPEELQEKIKDIAILGVRSTTQVPADVLKSAERLIAIGAFCIGTNQIALSEAAKRGIAVFNAPYSNTRSVVELTIGLIIMLYRGIFDKSVALHKGVWEKSAKGSYEIRQKKLGIVGYGNIGAQLSVIAESLGMDVYFYDVAEKLALGNAKKCFSLQELLSIADVVTLHVDGKPSNKNFFGENEFNAMKPGALFLNLSRGFVVDIEALAGNIQSGTIRGAAIDVFPSEPKGSDTNFSSPLQGLPNVILTPHIGGSTEEAQENIGRFVADRLMSFVNSGSTLLSVNMPNVQLPKLTDAHRFLHIHGNVPGVLGSINNILGKHRINIEGQYLGTNTDVGYVITDVDTNHTDQVITELKGIPGTIRFRALY